MLHVGELFTIARSANENASRKIKGQPECENVKV